MKQTFITLGEGLTDLFEFMTMIEYNHQRIDKIIYFHSPQAENKKVICSNHYEPYNWQSFPSILYHD